MILNVKMFRLKLITDILQEIVQTVYSRLNDQTLCLICLSTRSIFVPKTHPKSPFSDTTGGGNKLTISIFIKH